MTGCRQNDRFTASFWLCGSFQARPLPWVHCSHVISEKITLSATTDNKRLHHPDRINGHLREVQGLIQNELTLECQVKSGLNYREMGGVGGGFFLAVPHLSMMHQSPLCHYLQIQEFLAVMMTSSQHL